MADFQWRRWVLPWREEMTYCSAPEKVVNIRFTAEFAIERRVIGSKQINYGTQNVCMGQCCVFWNDTASSFLLATLILCLNLHTWRFRFCSLTQGQLSAFLHCMNLNGVICCMNRIIINTDWSWWLVDRIKQSANVSRCALCLIPAASLLMGGIWFLLLGDRCR